MGLIYSSTNGVRVSDYRSRRCRFDEKKCCLPVGGQPSRPNPPSGKQCPPKAWSWNDEHSCCAPHQPPVNTQPPQCDKDWSWSPDNFCCEKSSTPSGPGPSTCKDKEFWWVVLVLISPMDYSHPGQYRFGEKSCCLPVGGKPSPPSPPTGKQCPPQDWSWSDEHTCCVPHQPSVDLNGPQCDKDWNWSPDSFCCEQGSTPPPSSPGPSDCKPNEFW